ncbi:MAG: RpiB/LacA/LacB family sugar-phosphate isomerase [Patescibacteria group bacterium]|jgi:ribose 5-phosphate isomerase B
MVYLGADHGGFHLKEKIKQWLKDAGIAYADKGAFQLNPEDDYPDFAFAVAEAVANNPTEHKGILACRSAAGVIIAANKITGVRAVAPANVEAAVHSRLHNNANVLGLSGDWLDEATAKTMIQQWLTTAFSGEVRHQRRLDKISLKEQV